MGTMKKKKKKARAPKKTLKRPQRLLRAKLWLAAYSEANPQYADKQIVHSYAKKYRTGLAGAIVELKLLGVNITAAYEEAVTKALAQQAEQRRRLKEARLNAHLEGMEQDGHFAYIAGYTSGGAPYGLTWDELSEEERVLFTYKN